MPRLQWTPQEIRDLRIRLRCTQAEFGEKVKVVGQTVSDWECGRIKQIRPKYLRALDQLQRESEKEA